jgi:hypothetical protein
VLVWLGAAWFGLVRGLCAGVGVQLIAVKGGKESRTAALFFAPDVCNAGESCRSPMAAFGKPNSKVLPTRQRSFITVSIVPISEVVMMELAAT